MVDASERGGGICITRSEAQEGSAEARWSPKGQWLTIGDESGLAEYWQASLPEADDGMVTIGVQGLPAQICFRTLHFYHLYRGHHRPYDLGWYLLRMGGAS